MSPHSLVINMPSVVYFWILCCITGEGFVLHWLVRIRSKKIVGQQVFPTEKLGYLE